MLSPLQEIPDPLFSSRRVRLLIKRDDLLDPLISGNKWRKLKYNLHAFREQNHTRLLTFGGAYSNHIHATAAAGLRYGFETIGIIRGEADTALNPTLTFARSCGMRLVFWSRARYRQKDSAESLADLRQQFGRFYLLPEGGSNALAVTGCQEIVDELMLQTDGHFDYVACACGSGGTLTGLALGVTGSRQALGVAVLKGAGFLREQVSVLSQGARLGQWHLLLDQHWGGYARAKPGLTTFCARFEAEYDVPLEPVYTGKLVYALYQYCEAGRFPVGSTVIALHTGGLQVRSSP
ncbi:MAG: pyridoxal-phosphate dependent enzyme [Gammaproteobacteria bacterium]